MLPAYAELHCLSNFSFLRGASHPEELVERAQALGYAALALTDECSVAGVVRAHLAAKDAGLPLVIGSEFTLADGVKLVLYATDRASYGDLAQLDHARPAQRGEGQLRADARRCRGSSRRAVLALWVPPARRPRGMRRPSAADARWFADVFPGRAWIAVELFARAGDRARLARLRGTRARDRPAAGRRRRRPHARARAARAAGHAHRDPPAHAARRMRLRALPQRRAAPALARAARHALSARADRRDARRRRALHVLARRAALRVSGGDRAARARRRRRTCASWSRRGCGGATATRRVNRRRPRADRARARADRGAAATSPTSSPSTTSSRSRARKDILCQGRGSAANSAVCYALGITEVDPSRMSMLFERFISRSATSRPTSTSTSSTSGARR